MGDQEKSAFVNFHTAGFSSSSAMMNPVITESSSKATALQNAKCSLPNPSYFSWDSSMIMQSNGAMASSSLMNNACEPKNNGSNDIVIGRSVGSSCSLPLRSSVAWNAPKGGILATQNISQLSSDNGFAERAARLSCFGVGGGSLNLSEPASAPFHRSVIDNSAMSRIPRPNMAELTKVSDTSLSKEEACATETGVRKAGRLSRSSTPGHGTSGNESDDAEVSTAHEESSSSDQNTSEAAPNAFHGRKRKRMQKDKGNDFASLQAEKDTQSTEAVDGQKGMTYKVVEGVKEKDDVKYKVEASAKTGEGSPKQAKDNIQTSEPPKEDYIHVRARRGQATNSHSLAERVRREKISERMKFLQDLVPGCSKVTGKAVMLDEIINYVQSLQRQVEFLSMKLAAVNPRMEFNVEGILAKDMLQSQGSSPTMVFASDTSTSYPQLHQPQQGLVQIGTEGHGLVNQAEALRRTINAQIACIDGYGDVNAQLSHVWDNELQSVVQMGFVQNNHTPLTSQGNSDKLKI